MENTYCLSCKKLTGNENIQAKMTKNNKPYIKSVCKVCKKGKSRFLSINQIKGNGILSNLFRNIPILNKIF